MGGRPVRAPRCPVAGRVSGLTQERGDRRRVLLAPRAALTAAVRVSAGDGHPAVAGAPVSLSAVAPGRCRPESEAVGSARRRCCRRLWGGRRRFSSSRPGFLAPHAGAAAWARPSGSGAARPLVVAAGLPAAPHTTPGRPDQRARRGRVFLQTCRPGRLGRARLSLQGSPVFFGRSGHVGRLTRRPSLAVQGLVSFKSCPLGFHARGFKATQSVSPALSPP